MICIYLVVLQFEWEHNKIQIPTYNLYIEVYKKKNSSPTQTIQILTNYVQMLILRLSYSTTTVVRRQKSFLAKIQNRTNKKSGMEILLLSKFFGHSIKNLDGSGFPPPSFWSCNQKLGW